MNQQVDFSIRRATAEDVPAIRSVLYAVRQEYECAARGRGLGRQLLENMLSAARQNGFAEVWLETSSNLLGAITLYRQFGFVPDASASLTLQCDAAYLLRLK